MKTQAQIDFEKALAEFAKSAAKLRDAWDGLEGSTRGYPQMWGSFDEVAAEIAEWAHVQGVKP